MERANVPRLVVALPSQLHSQRPWRIGKIDDALSGDVDARHFIAHVAVHHLATGVIAEAVALLHLGIGANNGEAVVARGLEPQRDSVEIECADVTHQATIRSISRSAPAMAAGSHE